MGVKELAATLRDRVFGVGHQVTSRDFLLQRMPKHSVCAEVGVFKGDFSAQILRVVQPARLHLIDPWKYEESADYAGSLYGGQLGRDQAYMDHMYYGVEDRFGRHINAGVVSLHRAASSDAASRFADEYFDWVYIDGNHQYEFVKDDLEKFYPKVKRGGFIAGDDYGTKGWWDNGVTRAVDEFQSRCETVLIQSSQFILRKI